MWAMKRSISVWASAFHAPQAAKRENAPLRTAVVIMNRSAGFPANAPVSSSRRKVSRVMSLLSGDTANAIFNNCGRVAIGCMMV